MNGDDPNARTRRVPPPRGRPGEQRENQRPPERRIEPTQVMRRDGQTYRPPLAWSQSQDNAQKNRGAPPNSPGPRHNPAAPHNPNRDRAATRQPRQHSAPPRRTPQPLPGKRRSEPPRRRRKLHLFRWSLALVLVLVIAVIGMIVKLDTSLNRIPALTNYPGRLGDTPGTNWLLTGSDGREGLTPEQERELSTGGDVGPERSDTIMLVHLPRSGPATLISLPRDSYVSIPGHGKDKLNAAFAFGGPALLAQTVEQATGVHIDHYAGIGFGGFATMVDTLGGIDLCLEQPINDPLAGINLPAGCQRLNGPQALGFVRSRATPRADIDRIQHQRMFMAALLKKATGAGVLANPFTLWPLVSDTAKTMRVDNGDHIWDLASLARALRGDLVTTTVPIGGFADTDSGNVLLWDKQKAANFFDDLANDRPIPEDLLTR
ncbi:LytR family transcriptional regulator [Nocardia panacis]|uniref:LytR family transcriptional regulator n=1 Tax=Nocardia panacis TaxID=2340916 RepID=A0A3A4KNW9_9NOCA|nr:LCP family protein [Nocardia panacis]RJO77067.1 LytR family transcriptional regulator [Nocardia panacis]